MYQRLANFPEKLLLDNHSAPHVCVEAVRQRVAPPFVALIGVDCGAHAARRRQEGAALKVL